MMMLSARNIGLGLLLLGVMTAGGVSYALWQRRHRTTLSPSGTVLVDGMPIAPAELARREGLPLDVYALARAIASEHGGSPEIVMVAVGHAIRNYARKRGESVVTAIVRAKGAAHGFFGAQYQGRYVSSARDPQAKHVEVARKVLSGAVPDPTRGADQFDSPRAFAAQKGVTKTPEQVAVLRQQAGKELVALPGISTEHVRFWRSKGVA